MTIVSAFRASRGGTGIAPNFNHQGGGSHLAYTQFQANVAEINIGGHYNPATAIWSPPPGLVEISAMIWWHTTFAPLSATQPNAACIKVWKNGFAVELKAGPGYTPSGYPNTAGAALPAFIDLCEQGDYYSLWAYGTSMNAGNDLIIDGHHAHSWWCGKAFGPVS